MYLTIEGERTFLHLSGHGVSTDRPTVVFVHGAAEDHSVWMLQTRYFAYHSRNAVAVDLPGHGRSGGEPLASIGAIAEWITGVLDAIGIPVATLVGHSMGALAVLETAARHPGRVDRIALLGPAVPMAVSDMLRDAAREREGAAFDMITIWSHATPLGGEPVPGVWQTGAKRRLLERSRPGTLARDLANCSEYATGLDAASRVRCPALLVCARRDLMTPPKAATALANAMPQARIVTLEGAGHAMMGEDGGAVLDALTAFVSAA
jgi:pimeloyl-ACP methyl ester carboxylesterase